MSDSCSTEPFEIKQATSSQLAEVVKLFAEYHKTYGIDRQETRCENFIGHLLHKDQAIIYVAFSNQVAVGFALVYPGYSSVAMQPTWLLNDLYVNADYRRRKIASRLLQHVEKVAQKKKIFSLKLAANHGNDAANNLYNQSGYQLISNFNQYAKKL